MAGPTASSAHRPAPATRWCSGARARVLGIVASMSRKGDCWDNSVAESFFATIKGGGIDRRDRDYTSLRHDAHLLVCCPDFDVPVRLGKIAVVRDEDKAFLLALPSDDRVVEVDV